MFNDVLNLIRKIYGEGFISLHEPRFYGNEKKYVSDCIDSTFVSSVGRYVDLFEAKICEFTGSKFAVAVMNGTAALHMSLILNDVNEDDEVLTQALTFVATANAISYTGARPIFIDSASDNLGMCPESLESFLKEFAIKKNDGFTYNKKSGKRIKACVPMHVFGHPVKLDEIIRICESYNIAVIEDAAESLGSYYKGKHTGTIAPIGILSFNGNKIVTSGGGGMLLIQDEALAKKAKHLTTTAKVPHQWEFYHDQIGYNYRLPNLNAALACAQLENLPRFLQSKRKVTEQYIEFFKSKQDMKFIKEPENTISNYWLNAIEVKDAKTRDEFLAESQAAKIACRPIWKLMSDLPAFKDCQTTDLKNARRYQDTIINLPSSVVV